MTETGQPATLPRPLLALLDRFAEVLPIELLQSLQTASEKDKLTDKLVAKQLRAQGLALIALGVATSTNSALLQGIPEIYLPKLTELGEYIKSHAPALLAHPKIQSTARQIAENLDQSEEESEDQIGVPFDDLATIAANPTYFSSSNRLVPTVHLAISFTNRDPFPTVSLVLTDLASLTLALCKTLAQTVEDNVLVARSGLLDDRGLNRIREVADQLESEITKLKANLGSEVFAKATGQAATAK